MKSPKDSAQNHPARRWGDTVERNEPDRLDAGSPEAAYRRGANPDSPRPRALLIGLETGWLGVARLPRALQLAGFEVGVACRGGAFLAYTQCRDIFFPLPEKIYGHRIVRSAEKIIREWQPDLILPADDRTAVFLAGLHEQLAKAGKRDEVVKSLKRSLGNPTGVLEAANKQQTMKIAAKLGVRVPEHQTVHAEDDIAEFGRKHGFPVMLKSSFDSGGHGVVICKSQAEIATALWHLTKYESLKWRFSLWRDQLWGRALGPRWLPVDKGITVSRHIEGRCGTSLVAAFEGRMLAGLTAVRENGEDDGQSSSCVVRITENAEMRSASQTMLEYWGLTGLIGFDFMIDAQGRAWMIECNPRATPIAHLGNRVGEDVCNALFCEWTGSPPRIHQEALPDLVVALFPQESWRDPHSPYLRDAFHDVPSHDQELLDFIRESRPD